MIEIKGSGIPLKSFIDDILYRICFADQSIIIIYDNEIIVKGTNSLPNGNVFESHNDHRITMSLGVISTILKTPSILKDTECINKSYPAFFKDLEKLEIGVENE